MLKIDETKRVRVTNMPTIHTWWIGFLFTLGYVGLDLVGPWYMNVLEFVMLYIIWPYALGANLGVGL